MRQSIEHFITRRRWVSVAFGVGFLLCGMGAYAHARDASEVPSSKLDGTSVELDLSAHGPYGSAIVALPVSANAPRPLVVALHGRTEKPERMCALVRDMVGPNAFVLCPRGEPASEGYGFDFANDSAAAAEIEAGIDSLRDRFGSKVDTESRIYIGFSRGAFVGPAVVSVAPATYPRAVLIEGGHDLWTDEAIDRFSKSGGVRVMFACGTPECMDVASRPADLLSKSGVDTKRVYGDGQGHDMGGAVKAAIVQAWPWLVAGDSRWTND